MILMRNRTSHSRRGFTLVELMVAAALSITIMWILAESFKMGIDFARSARSTGDMMTQLNNAGQIFTRDLKGDHFLVLNPGLNNNNGKLSSIRPDLMTFSGTGYTPPNGYFQLVSPPPSASISDISEGFLLNTVTNNFFSFTVYLPAGLPQNLFTATDVNGKPYPPTQAAEVGYFLVPTGTMTPPTPGSPGAPQPLFTLNRRQRLVAVTSADQPILQFAVNNALNNLNNMADPSPWDVVSTTTLPTGVTVNMLSSFSTPYPGPTPFSPSQPATRLFGDPRNPPTPSPLATTGRVGDDVLLSNVLSFEVLAAWDVNNNIQQPSQPIQPVQAFAPLPSPRPFTVQLTGGNPNYVPTSSPVNSNYPFDNLPLLSLNRTGAPTAYAPYAFGYTFDTWFQFTPPPPNSKFAWNNFSLLATPAVPQNPNLIPMPLRVTALQIIVRIYDPKTKQARQNTWRIAL